MNFKDFLTSEVYKLHELSWYISQFKKIPQKLDAKNTDVLKVAFVSSFTINGLAETLTVMSVDDKIPISVYSVPYKQHNQEILNPESRLYSFDPQIIFLLFDIHSLIPGVTDFVSESDVSPTILSLEATVMSYVNSLQKLTKARIICGFFSPHQNSVLGELAASFSGSIAFIFQQLKSKLALMPELNSRVFFLDTHSLAAQFGIYEFYDPKLYFLGDYVLNPRSFPFLAYRLQAYIKAQAGKTKKCIVVDLDNTLWGGIVGEDGFKNIKISPHPPGNAYRNFQQTLLDFYRRGVLLAINSNNNLKDAMEVIDTHPGMILHKEHFASIIINWDDKVANMKRIAEELNIGLDSLVFVDDDPKKRLLMRTLLPQVLTLELPLDPAYYSLGLTSINDFFQFQITKQDLSRGVQYFQQTQRKKVASAAQNLDEYLKNLKLKIAVLPVTSLTIPRISQLTQRTNQFNMTTYRYSEADIEKFLHDPVYKLYTFEVIDRFGSYGICAVAIIKKVNSTSWEIDSFLLSCRVLGLGVEKTILSFISNQARDNKIKKIFGIFIPTEKNHPAEDVYKNIGFKLVKRDKKFQKWIYGLKELISSPDHIHLENNYG